MSHRLSHLTLVCVDVCSVSVEDGATTLLDEPHLGLLLRNTLELADSGLVGTSSGDTLAATAEDDVEVHTEDTGAGIVLDAEVDVFVDTEAKVACYNN